MKGIILPELHPKSALAPRKPHLWEQPTESSSQHCSSGEPPPSKASKLPPSKASKHLTPRITALSSLHSTAQWQERTSQLRVDIQGENSHKQSSEDFIFPFMVIFYHTSSTSVVPHLYALHHWSSSRPLAGALAVRF